MSVLDKLIKYAEEMKEVELSLRGDCDAASIKEKKAKLEKADQDFARWTPLLAWMATELEDGTLIKKAIRKVEAAEVVK